MRLRSAHAGHRVLLGSDLSRSRGSRRAGSTRSRRSATSTSTGGSSRCASSTRTATTPSSSRPSTSICTRAASACCASPPRRVPHAGGRRSDRSTPRSASRSGTARASPGCRPSRASATPTTSLRCWPTRACRPTLAAAADDPAHDDALRADTAAGLERTGGGVGTPIVVVRHGRPRLLRPGDQPGARRRRGPAALGRRDPPRRRGRASPRSNAPLREMPQLPLLAPKP